MPAIGDATALTIPLVPVEGLNLQLTSLLQLIQEVAKISLMIIVGFHKTEPVSLTLETISLLQLTLLPTPDSFTMVAHTS